MRSNPRLFIRSLQNTIIKSNPIVIIFCQIKKMIEISLEIPHKSKKINKSILESKSKLEKAQSIIKLKSEKTCYINLIR
jgi:hypothetical protein